MNSIPPPVTETFGSLAWATAQIRELGGAVRRLEAELAEMRATLAPLGGMQRCQAMATIVSIVAAEFGLPAKLLCGDWRRRDMVEARHVAMWIAREGLGRSYSTIGAYLGRRDHKTVWNGVEATKARRDANPEFRARTDRLRDQAVNTIGGE